jgi:hypothetical protein
MDHDRTHPERKLPEERVANGPVKPLYRRVDAHVAEREVRRRAQICRQMRQLVTRQRRQLDGERRHAARFVDESVPVPSETGEHSGRDPNRVGKTPAGAAPDTRTLQRHDDDF